MVSRSAISSSNRLALRYKLCHTLGGTFNLPHALAYNAPAAPQTMRRVAQSLEKSNGPQAVYDPSRDNGAPVALRDSG